MKRLRRVLISIFVIALVPVLIALFLLATGPGLSLTTQLVNRLASSGDTIVEISGLDGVLSGPLSLDQVTVADADGVWLTVSEIEVELSRTALLTGGIDASRLSVSGIDVARRPSPGEQSGNSSGGLPSIRARVDNIFVRSIALSAPVLGEAAELQLTGSVLLRENPVDLSGVLDLVRIDGKSGEISSKWTVAPSSNELALNVSVREPGDGLLARALDIQGLPALAVDVDGAGPLENWKATLGVSLDGQRTVEGSVSLALGDTRQSVDAMLEGNLGPLVPQRITPFFAGKTQIELSAERDGENTYRFRKLFLKSALTSLDASGHILPDSDEIDLTADLTFGMADSRIQFDVAENTQLDIGYTTLTTTMKGSLEKAQWTLDGAVASFSDGARSLTDARLSGRSSQINFLDASGPLEISLQTSSFSTGNGDLDKLVGGAVSASMSGSIDGNALTLDASQLSAGQIEAKATGDVDLAAGSFDLLLDASVAEQQEAPWDGLLGPQATRIAGKVARDTEGVLLMSAVSVESGNLQASLSGEVSPDTLQLEGTAGLAALQSLNEGLNGSLDATLALSGAIAEPKFSLSAKGNDITILEKPLEDLAFDVNGMAGSAGPTVDIKLTGRYEAQPISVAAGIRAGQDGGPVVETLDLTAPGAQASGRLQADTNGILVGALDLDVTSLAELGPLLLQDGLSGALSGTVTFAEQDSVQKIDVSLSSETLELAGVQLSGTRVAALVLDPQQDLNVQATVSNDAVTISGTSLRNVKSVVNGTPQALRFAVDGSLASEPLSVAGEVSSQHGTTTIELDRASGRYASIPIQLASPATITLAQQGTQVETLTLQAGQGRIVVEGSLTDQLDFDIRLQGFPLALLEQVAPSDLGQVGTANATAKISGSPSNPLISYDLRLQNVSVKASREAQIPPIAVTSTGTFQGMVLKTNATASGGGMNLTAGGSVDVSGVPALNLTVNGSAPFEFAAIPLSSAGIVLEGGVQVALSVTGTSQSPQIRGQLTTRNATFVEVNSALTIRDIVGQIDFVGTRAQITQLQGRVGTKGRLTISGSIDLDPASGLPADLKIAVADGTYTNGEIITAQYDADLTVSGPMMRTGAIGGTVSLRRTDLSIPEKLPASIPFVDVKHKHASKAIIEQAQEIAPQSSEGSDSGSGGGLQLDLTVDAPRRIFFRGRGIDSEFGGSLRVFGPVSNPRASGSFSMIRGRLDLLTKRFDFDRGTITFAGPMDPSLDFQTTTTVSGTSYSIVIGGTASAPDISFTSSPTMPQDEILANLFFGRNLSKLSPLQIAQLANAISQLSGASSGDGLLGRLRSLTGVADINLIQDEDGNGTSLGIGSYLNDRTYINVEKGLSGNSGKVTIDIDLTDNLKARGEAGSDGETKAGIFFERDY